MLLRAFRRFFVCGLQSLPGLIPLTVAPTVPHRRDMEGPVVIASALPPLSYGPEVLTKPEEHHGF